jgi:uncharacterized membrane protein YbhN (UPF0104 family)
VLALSVISAAWLLLGGSDLVHSVGADGRVLLVSAVIVALGVVVASAVGRSTPIRSRIDPFTRRLLSSPATHPILALVALALTAAFWAIQIGIMAALLELFGVAVSLSLLFGIMGVPVLVGMFSPVPGGAGVREALMAAAARLAGIPAGPVVLAAVAYRLALFLVTPLVWTAVRLARAGANHP